MTGTAADGGSGGGGSSGGGSSGGSMGPVSSTDEDAAMAAALAASVAGESAGSPGSTVPLSAAAPSSTQAKLYEEFPFVERELIDTIYATTGQRLLENTRQQIRVLMGGMAGDTGPAEPAAPPGPRKTIDDLKTIEYTFMSAELQSVKDDDRRSSALRRSVLFVIQFRNYLKKHGMTETFVRPLTLECLALNAADCAGVMSADDESSFIRSGSPMSVDTGPECTGDGSSSSLASSSSSSAVDHSVVTDKDSLPADEAAADPSATVDSEMTDVSGGIQNAESADQSAKDSEEKKEEQKQQPPDLSDEEVSELVRITVHILSSLMDAGQSFIEGRKHVICYPNRSLEEAKDEASDGSGRASSPGLVAAIVAESDSPVVINYIPEEDGEPQFDIEKDFRSWISVRHFAQMLKSALLLDARGSIDVIMNFEPSSK